MNKNNKNFLVDTALLSLLKATGISGLMLWACIPRGTPVRRLFRDMHKFSGIALTGLAAYHFCLHWGWYKKTGMELFSTKKVDQY